ncbi:MAG TPA: carbon-nitrogen hydrolase family protein [bacterium]|nr:carbon-nitrogen hydrolase family protein [bacterium]
MIVSVAALQYPLGGPITLEDQLHLLRRRPDFLCLPEYFSVRPGDRSHADSAPRIAPLQRALTKLSRDLTGTVIGGTIPHPVDGGYANLATVYHRGEIVGSYQKVNPLGREEERGIIPGTEYRVFEVNGARIGILICADVLNPQSFVEMRRLGADVIFAPTVSPYRESDTVFDKDRRDTEIYVAGAQTARAFIVKTCGIGTIFGHPLQGRSGIFAPWGVLARVPPDAEQQKIILCEYLDIDEIREFKTRMDALESAGAPAQA